MVSSSTEISSIWSAFGFQLMSERQITRKISLCYHRHGQVALAHREVKIVQLIALYSNEMCDEAQYDFTCQGNVMCK